MVATALALFACWNLKMCLLDRIQLVLGVENKATLPGFRVSTLNDLKIILKLTTPDIGPCHEVIAYEIIESSLQLEIISIPILQSSAPTFSQSKPKIFVI
jgi:hypothetical protein